MSASPGVLPLTFEMLVYQMLACGDATSKITRPICLLPLDCMRGDAMCERQFVHKKMSGDSRIASLLRRLSILL